MELVSELPMYVVVSSHEEIAIVNIAIPAIINFFIVNVVCSLK